MTRSEAERTVAHLEDIGIALGLIRRQLDDVKKRLYALEAEILPQEQGAGQQPLGE